MNKTPVMVITSIGGQPDDDLFHNDFGSWNVSLALRDCRAGKHPICILDVEEAYKANKAVETDKAKVRRFMRSPEVFEQPLLGVMESGACWLIDGHHRLRAMHRMRIREFAAFVIEDGAPYQVFYNGKRRPPYKPF